MTEVPAAGKARIAPAARKRHRAACRMPVQRAMTSSRITRTFAALAFAAAFGAGVADAAQGSKWWQSDVFRRELGLTSEQSRRLEEIFQTALPKLRALKSSLDEAEAQLEKLIERGSDAAVMEQVNTVEAARKDLNISRSTMLLKMRRVLTTDQWVKFTALHQAQERERARAAGRGQ
jgi:Spy/CpxP family protein refolding chaperone